MSQPILTDCCFNQFNLHSQLQQGLNKAGFIRCTPIQELTLPVALAGRDIAAQAQTGTGKTAAFLVAVMNRLLSARPVTLSSSPQPRALIIAPTRELAIQIDRDAQAMGATSSLKTALIYGGVDYEKQRQQLQHGCDIIIATPGRLLDYYRQHLFDLKSIEVMVVDEADRMFDLGFIRDVRFIFRRLPAREKRQVLLFSATLSHRVLELAYEHMHEAQKLVVQTDNITADKVKQRIYFPAKEEKCALLLNLLDREKTGRSLIFVNTRAVADQVTEKVKQHGYRVAALSGDVPQPKRQKLLQRFEHHQLDMLVCTDVAARGLHISGVSHVFNYDLPQDAEDYVHRIGRTARLGAEGDAISFACDLYAMSLPDIETYIKQKIPVAMIAPEMLVMPRPRQVKPETSSDKVPVRKAGHTHTTSQVRQSSSKVRHQRQRSRSEQTRSPTRPAAHRRKTATAGTDNTRHSASLSASRRRQGGGRRRHGASTHTTGRMDVPLHQPRGAHTKTSRTAHQSSFQVTEPAKTPKKLSFLHRLSRLFTGRRVSDK